MNEIPERSEADRLARLSVTFGIFAILVGAFIAIATTGWHWTSKTLVMVILGLAAFACLTLVSRGKSGAVAAWLRKPAGVSGLYARMLLPRFARFWVRRCDPAPRRRSPWGVFRAALTWRLFDLALLIAVAYPILLLFAPFIIWGGAVGLGSEVVIDAVPFWDLSHLVTLVLFGMLAAAIIWRRSPKHRGAQGVTPPRCFAVSLIGVNNCRE